MKQPKPFLEKIRLRNKSYGKERRLEMSKLILDHAPTFPLGVSYEDIDKAFFKWVDEEIDLSYEGSKLPTFKLYSNQHINEYAQSWKHLDEVGNLLMNFKTVTREINPKKGESQGNVFNIPGNRDYPMFIVPTLQENGQEVYDMYTMKQPMSIDFIYSLTIITNKVELINKANMVINDKFKSIQCYIAPNNHSMPMKLEEISDESEYAIDDRKYYSQTFKIKLLGYIINPDDFKVHRLPSRLNISLTEEYNKKKKVSVTEGFNKNKKDSVTEEITNNKINLTIPFDKNVSKISFVSDVAMTLESFDLASNIENIYIYINDENMNIEERETLVNVYKDDKITIIIKRQENTTHFKTSIQISGEVENDINGHIVKLLSIQY